MEASGAATERGDDSERVLIFRATFESAIMPARPWTPPGVLINQKAVTSPLSLPLLRRLSMATWSTNGSFLRSSVGGEPAASRP